MSGPNLSPAEMLRDRALAAAIGCSHHMPSVMFSGPEVPDSADTAEDARQMTAFSRTIETAQVDRTLRIARRFESYLRGGAMITDDELAELTWTERP